jgi:hypothetical protein
MTLQVERRAIVAYVRKKTLKDGSIRWYARYLGTDERYHEEGGYSSKLAAARPPRRTRSGLAVGTGCPRPQAG